MAIRVSIKKMPQNGGSGTTPFVELRRMGVKVDSTAEPSWNTLPADSVTGVVDTLPVVGYNAFARIVFNLDCFYTTGVSISWAGSSQATEYNSDGVEIVGQHTFDAANQAVTLIPAPTTQGQSIVFHLVVDGVAIDDGPYYYTEANISE